MPFLFLYIVISVYLIPLPAVFLSSSFNSVTRLSTFSSTILGFLVTAKLCFACVGSSVPYRSAHEPLITVKWNRTKLKFNIDALYLPTTSSKMTLSGLNKVNWTLLSTSPSTFPRSHIRKKKAWRKVKVYPCSFYCHHCYYYYY